MKIYKRPWHSAVTSLLWGIVGAAFAGVVLHWLRTSGISIARVINLGPWDFPEWVPIAVAGALLAFAVWSTLMSEKIRFELDGPVFRYYQGGDLRQEFNLPDYYIDYSPQASDGSTDSQTLFLWSTAGGDKVTINITPLGLSRATKMFEDMERYAKKDAAVAPPQE
ncbi:MAG: hypothetical protein LBH11_03150 [Propionibacteriaceae bacterium]|jgi:hypothetical protein|nr:hypothetical protein [Propionibacteriaceae bacterium]